MSLQRRKSVRSGLRCGLALAALPLGLPAQMHHVDAPERVTRAVGVYEWTGELGKPTAARFVPVSLFIDGHMEDAGLYLARPVPFALQTGDVYALEHAGEPEGLLDLDYAQHVVTGQALADDDPAGAWYGYGKFRPETPSRVVPLHASSHLPVIQSNGVPASDGTPAADDGRPHMNRRDNSAPATTTGGSAGSGAAAGTAAKDSGTKDSGSANSGSPDASGGSSKSSSTGADTGDDTDRPTLRHRDPSQDASRSREYGTRSKQASVTAAGPAPGDDPDRPVLGRSNVDDKGTPPLTGLPADLHQAVAVSDPAHRDQHDFARAWDTPEERAQTLAALEAAARPQVMAYLAENRLVPARGPAPTETKSPVSASAASTPAAGPLPPAATAPEEGDAPAPPKLQRGVPSSSRSGGAVAPAIPPAPDPAAPTAAPRPAPSQSSAAAAPGKPVNRHPHSPTPPSLHGPIPLTLSQQQLAGFTLSYGGLPTFVYTAVAAVAEPPAHDATSTATRAASDRSAQPRPAALYVTLVAQRLPSGELQVALSDVTDSLHLDRGPRLRLIDAVDPDDSHRASLLFELRGTSSRQFALYRLTSVKAEQTFTTASIE